MNKFKKFETTYSLNCKNEAEKTVVFGIIMCFENLVIPGTEITLKQIEIEIKNKAPKF